MLVGAEREVAGEPRRAKRAADDGRGEDLRALREFVGVTRGRKVPPEGSGIREFKGSIREIEGHLTSLTRSPE